MALKVLQGDRNAQDRQLRKAPQSLSRMASVATKTVRYAGRRAHIQEEVRALLGDLADAAVC